MTGKLPPVKLPPEKLHPNKFPPGLGFGLGLGIGQSSGEKFSLNQGKCSIKK